VPPADCCAPQPLRLAPVEGKVLINAQITDRYHTRAASSTIQGIRAAVGKVDGAHALVGGQTAINYDIQQASRHDRNLIIPIVLVVIFVSLAEIGFAVAFSVLLDTIVVRSILVPARSHDIGRRIWWRPSTLARGAE
jgi:RND superfamily putative drug exporter